MVQQSVESGLSWFLLIRCSCVKVCILHAEWSYSETGDFLLVGEGLSLY